MYAEKTGGLGEKRWGGGGEGGESESESEKTIVCDSNDSNKIGMGFALSRDLFYFGVFVAAAEFRLGFGRCSYRFCDVLTLNNIDRNQPSLRRP